MFFVANRGHHADIGGITPGRYEFPISLQNIKNAKILITFFSYHTNVLGSMPPHSKILAEEGATFRSFKLVEQGIFDEKGRRLRLHGRFSSLYS